MSLQEEIRAALTSGELGEAELGRIITRAVTARLQGEIDARNQAEEHRLLHGDEMGKHCLGILGNRPPKTSRK